MGQLTGYHGPIWAQAPTEQDLRELAAQGGVCVLRLSSRTEVPGVVGITGADPRHGARVRRVLLSEL